MNMDSDFISGYFIVPRLYSVDIVIKCRRVYCDMSAAPCVFNVFRRLSEC